MEYTNIYTKGSGKPNVVLTENNQLSGVSYRICLLIELYQELVSRRISIIYLIYPYNPYFRRADGIHF